MPVSKAVSALVVLFLCLAGCKPAAVPSGEQVSGTVTFEGEPVTYGVINFLGSESGVGASAELQPDGTYLVKGPIPVGEYKVFFTPPLGPPPTDPQGSKPPDAVDLPQKYRSDQTTDLTAEIALGKNEATNFELEP